MGKEISHLTMADRKKQQKESESPIDRKERSTGMLVLT